MKRIVLAAAVTIAIAACNNSKVTKNSNGDSMSMESSNGVPVTGPPAKPVDPATAPKIKYEKELYDFGTRTAGEKVVYNFKFKNVGKSPLIISNAEASCGCTIPEYPKNPVNPGEEGIIKVIFDSTGKMGMQNKVVTITSNTIPPTSELRIVGDIKEAK